MVFHALIAGSPQGQPATTRDNLRIGDRKENRRQNWTKRLTCRLMGSTASFPRPSFPFFADALQYLHIPKFG
jgi:hypothetical protein